VRTRAEGGRPAGPGPTVPAGADRATFTADLRHAHEGATPVVVSALYGADRRVLPLTIRPRPLARADPRAARSPRKYVEHRHNPDG
jgi:hypothetical protein